MYGVSQAKWYEESNDKESIGQLKNVGDMGTYKGRELILEQNRPALQKAIRFNFVKFVHESTSHHFRNSKTMISKVCPGLFSDPRHIQGQFFYLTGAGISQQIEENLEGHLGLLLL